MFAVSSLLLASFFFFNSAQAAAIAENNNANSPSLPSQWHRRAGAGCQPFTSTFPPSDVKGNGFTSFLSNAPFIAISAPGSYSTPGNGLEMFLKRPIGPVTKEGHTNSVVGQGATINSTFTVLYGKVTMEMSAPLVAGSVTAGILISDGHDEIDVEILGGDKEHWQSNVYAPSPTDQRPLWGVFGEMENVGSSDVSSFHNYTIDWSSERIQWSVDDTVVRTLKPSQTIINGTQHYPSQAARIQLGIWDASTPEGTSEWAKGPIDWNAVPPTVTATVKRVSVECGQ